MGLAQAGVYLPLKALLGGSGINLTETATSITVATTGSGPGGGDMLKSVYAPSNVAGKVDHAITADNLAAGGSVPLANAANSVPWSGVTGKPATFSPSDYLQLINLPTYFPTQWSQVANQPTVFPSDWSHISGIPAAFTPLPHGSTHLPGGSDGVALASATAPGWLAQLDGQVNSYVGGDNHVHPLPGATSDYGDLQAPLSPSVYDDEFTGTSLSSKWTPSNSAGTTTGLLQPTYYQMVQPFGTTGHTKIQLSQAFGTGANPPLAAGFQFQFKFRFQMNPYAPATAGNSNYLDVHLGLTFSTTRSIGFLIEAQTFYPPSGIAASLYFLTAWATNGPSTNIGIGGGPINNGQQFVMTGLDLRVKIGLFGGNLQIWLSNDGWNWTLFYTEIFNGGPSLNNNYPDHMILDFDNANSNQANSSGYVAWDYVRKIA